MLRRPIIEEPISRLAIWSNRLALFALAIAALSVIVLRTDLLELVPAITAFAAALLLAGLAVLLSLAAAVVIWRQGLGGIGRGVAGFFIGAALLAYPGYLGYLAYKLPPIHDITTDTTNPPRFDVISRLRPRGSSNYLGQTVAARQRSAYSDIAPLQVLATPTNAFEAALAVVKKRKWVVIDQRSPAGRREGAIEAVSRTLIMGLRDDVVIRVAALGTGAQVDVRSASRVDFPDFGANAARVRALLDDIDDAVSNQSDARPEPEKKPRPQPAKR